MMDHISKTIHNFPVILSYIYLYYTNTADGKTQSLKTFRRKIIKNCVSYFGLFLLLLCFLMLASTFLCKYERRNTMHIELKVGKKQTSSNYVLYKIDFIFPIQIFFKKKKFSSSNRNQEA